MHLYHQTCRASVPRVFRWLPMRWLRRWGWVPWHVRRMRLQPRAQIEIDAAMRTYRCEGCAEVVHIDMDWDEGATPEPDARID